MKIIYRLTNKPVVIYVCIYKDNNGIKIILHSFNQHMLNLDKKYDIGCWHIKYKNK